MTDLLIPYYRVSTKKQARSGLGLEAQQEAVSEFKHRTGGTVLIEYTEVETGKRADRPELTSSRRYGRRSRINK